MRDSSRSVRRIDAVISGRAFSFLRSFLMWGGLIALGAIALGIMVGFHLGTYFSMAMIGLAGASMLYDTSKIPNVYAEDRYIAAAMEFFASINRIDALVRPPIFSITKITVASTTGNTASGRCFSMGALSSDV